MRHPPSPPFNGDYVLLTLLGIIMLALSCAGPEDVALETTREVEPSQAAEQVSEIRRVHFTVPQGAQLTIVIRQDLSSEANLIGDPVEGVLANDYVDAGRIVIPEGSIVRGRITDAYPTDGTDGYAGLAFSFDTLVMPDGTEYPIQVGFARLHTGVAGVDSTSVIIGRVLEKDELRRLVPGIELAEPAALSTSINVPGMEVELPAGTVVRLTSRAPFVVQVDGG